MSETIKTVLEELNIELPSLEFDVQDLLGQHDFEGFDDLIDESNLYELLDYDGSLHELVDNHIDIYNYDLRKWAVDNYEYVEQAIEEGLCEGFSDFHKLIQSGQYVKYSQEMREEIEEIASTIKEKLEEIKPIGSYTVSNNSGVLIYFMNDDYALCGTCPTDIELCEIDYSSDEPFIDYGIEIPFNEVYKC